MAEKTLIYQRLLKFFVLALFFLLISCEKTKENCKFNPDWERIGESVMDSMDDMKRAELRSAKLKCGF